MPNYMFGQRDLTEPDRLRNAIVGAVQRHAENERTLAQIMQQVQTQRAVGGILGEFYRETSPRMSVAPVQEGDQPPSAQAPAPQTSGVAGPTLPELTGEPAKAPTAAPTTANQMNVSYDVPGRMERYQAANNAIARLLNYGEPGRKASETLLNSLSTYAKLFPESKSGPEQFVGWEKVVGPNGQEAFVPKVEKYDPASKKWYQTVKGPMARFGTGAAAAKGRTDGRIYDFFSYSQNNPTEPLDLNKQGLELTLDDRLKERKRLEDRNEKLQRDILSNEPKSIMSKVEQAQAEAAGQGKEYISSHRAAAKQVEDWRKEIDVNKKKIGILQSRSKGKLEPQSPTPQGYYGGGATGLIIQGIGDENSQEQEDATDEEQ